MRTPRFVEAAASFRAFFHELRDAFLEREALFTQLELALLCREHVLVIGPPGTAKSAIAGAVLGRIVDEKTARPSLFAKQLAENTVQTDLIGPVDFKVLTETGRTEYITDDGMLGATHAFLDEVFDGRDMLLRSILNVLHERELKHGRKVTLGKCECAVMTSNRYLSEVLARSPETLLAFADRISFICFCPKGFARRSSRAQMLHRAITGQRPALKSPLSLQDLDVLQDAVTQVEVSGVVTEGLELLADGLEKALLAQVSKLPDYVPTKYFSQRSMVKALWALKAAVVRDVIYRRPDRALAATTDDLATLRYFFLLGGPPPEELDLLVKAAADPRERAQLEIIKVEHRAFDDVLAGIQPGLDTSIEREAAELHTKDDHAAAEAMLRQWQPAVASTTAASLKKKLSPGPRHKENRAPLLSAASTLVAALERRLMQGMAGQGEGRGGVVLLGSFGDVLELIRVVPELAPNLSQLGKSAIEFCKQALQMIAASAEGTEYDDTLTLEGLTGLAANLSEELTRMMQLLQALSTIDSPGAEAVAKSAVDARVRVADALRRRAARTFTQTRSTRAESLDSLAIDARRLREFEDALVEISPVQRGLARQLLAPLGETYAREAFASTQTQRLEQLSRVVQVVLDSLRREGCPPEPALKSSRGLLEARVKELALSQSAPKLRVPEAAEALSGGAYNVYRTQIATSAPEGELAAFAALDSSLAQAMQDGKTFFSPEVRESMANLELAALSARVRYLRSWLSQLLGSLPAPEDLQGRAEADRTFEKLVRSRFPMLATREGELVRLEASLRRLLVEPGPKADAARSVSDGLRGVAEDFASYSRRLLDARAAK